MSQVIAESGLCTTVAVVPGGDIRDPSVGAELWSFDLLIGCVDRDWPRLILCEAAYQYLIPFIDLGTEIRVANGEIQSLDARVSFVGQDGRACSVHESSPKNEYASKVMIRKNRSASSKWATQKTSG